MQAVLIDAVWASSMAFGNGSRRCQGVRAGFAWDSTTAVALAFMFLSVDVNADPPSILMQPSSQIALHGTPATFEVRVSGSPPLQFQWQINRTNLPGATNTTLTLPADALSETAIFGTAVQVAVSNADGELISAEVLLIPFTFRFETGVVSLAMYATPYTAFELHAADSLGTSSNWSRAGSAVVPININTASTELLQQIPEMEENLAQAIILTRNGPDGIPETEDDLSFRSLGELANVPGTTSQLVQTIARFCSVVDAPARFRDPRTCPSGLPNPHDPPACTNGVLPTIRFYRIALIENATSQ